MILSDSLFILLLLLSVLALYKVDFYLYVLSIIAFFISNLLFVLYVYISSILYFKFNKISKKIKYPLLIIIGASIVLIFKLDTLSVFLQRIFFLNILINSSNIMLSSLYYIIVALLTIIVGFALFFKGYKNTIFNLNVSSNTFSNNTNRKTKSRTVIKSLIYKDLKKIWGNSTFRQSLIFGNGIFIMFFIIMFSLLLPRFTTPNMTIVFFIALANIAPCAASISSGLIQNLISLDGQDLELIYSLPITYHSILKSKIISALIISLPLILTSLVLNTIFYRKSPLLIILCLISTLLTYTTSIIISLYYDSKNPNFLWFNSKDLIEDYEKTFKLIGLSSITTVPLYILSIIFKGNYLLILLPSFINLYFLINNYKKLATEIKTLSF